MEKITCEMKENINKNENNTIFIVISVIGIFVFATAIWLRFIGYCD